MPHPSAADRDQIEIASKNFTVSEWDCRDGTPVPDVLRADLAEYIQRNIQPIRTFFDAPLHVTSGYRHPEYNRQIGGARWSFHQYGHVEKYRGTIELEANVSFRAGQFATDFFVQGVTPVQVRQVVMGLIRIGVLEPGGVGLYDKFVHYDNRGTLVTF